VEAESLASQRCCFAGILCLAAVSWFAADVVNSFFSGFNSGAPQEFGSALYVGWVASVSYYVSGFLI